MNILYGVTGEGFGHSSRSQEIILHLQKEGHRVLILTYGQAYPVLKDFFNKKEYKNKVEIYRVEGFHISFEKGKVSVSETILKNIEPAVKNIKNWDKIIKKVKSFSPKVAITDFEPLTANISYYLGLPLISIDNQHRITHMKIKVPAKYQTDFFIAKGYVSLCPPIATNYITLSFTKSKLHSKKDFIVSPVLRKEIINLKKREGTRILVYQTQKDLEFLKVLKEIKEKFIVYGYNKNLVDGNIHYKKAGREFLKDLSECKGIIATAGFTLISEALYLKKPYFAVPLRGQFEQVLNALYLKQSGMGDFSEEPTKDQLEKFVSDLPRYRKKFKDYKTNPEEANEVLDKILRKL
ncbi:Glycosyl transferase family 1 [uncultured archaeon]|nr:Glycosyl transferase family 1 [uncultured archaeon]